jgi:methionyl-tRNA formyltransferase
MKLLALGTGPFAVPMFQSLLESSHSVAALVTRPTQEAHGRRKSPVNPMRDAAEAHGLPIFHPQDINSGEGRRVVADLRPDLLVVCDYGQILSAETLSLAPLGGINLHASLLPKYRGAAPINWAILEGETETGVTVIHMTPRLDAGPSLVQRTIAIGVEESAVELEVRLARLGAAAVLEAIGMLADWDRHSPLGELQDAALATRARRLRKEDGQVDWSRSAVQIRNQVRALKPWPGTFTHWHPAHGEPLRLILDQVAIVDHVLLSAEPGAVVRADSSSLHAATGAGVVSIERLQPAGKRLMSADEFLRGHRVEVGQRFG